MREIVVKTEEGFLAFQGDGFRVNGNVLIIFKYVERTYNKTVRKHWWSSETVEETKYDSEEEVAVFPDGYYAGVWFNEGLQASTTKASKNKAVDTK